MVLKTRISPVNSSELAEFFEFILEIEAQYGPLPNISLQFGKLLTFALGSEKIWTNCEELIYNRICSEIDRVILLHKYKPCRVGDPTVRFGNHTEKRGVSFVNAIHQNRLPKITCGFCSRDNRL